MTAPPAISRELQVLVTLPSLLTAARDQQPVPPRGGSLDPREMRDAEARDEMIVDVCHKDHATLEKRAPFKLADSGRRASDAAVQPGARLSEAVTPVATLSELKQVLRVRLREESFAQFELDAEMVLRQCQTVVVRSREGVVRPVRPDLLEGASGAAAAGESTVRDLHPLVRHAPVGRDAAAAQPSTQRAGHEIGFQQGTAADRMAERPGGWSQGGGRQGVRARERAMADEWLKSGATAGAATWPLCRAPPPHAPCPYSGVSEGSARSL